MAVFPRVGDRFGRYQIDDQVGQGGMGVVFGATDTAFDRRVALKVVSALLGDSDEFRMRFDREAAVLARLDSPHVIQIFDYGIEDDCPYLATQYVGGGDLGDLLTTRGAMPPQLAARVCAQVADALHDAHLAGIVHRDVKPSNVLLRDPDVSELHAYLCDFGIARLAGEGLTAPGSVAGTWSYLSPECGRGEFGTPASDVYALGCLFWATLTGEAPYTGTDVAIAVAHQRSQVRQLVGGDAFTTAANAILARSMAKEPADRYPDADRMRSDLLALTTIPVENVTPGPVQAPAPPGVVPPPPPSSTFPRGAAARSDSTGRTGPRAAAVTAAGPPARRRTGLVVAGAVVAVLLVAGGVVAVTTLGGDDPQPGADPTSSGTPTDDTSGAPERLDEGGPITGDLDGDGLGDVGIAYTRPTKKAVNTVEATTWHSDGSRLVDEQSEVIDDDPDKAVLRWTGQLDGDEVTDIADVTYVDQQVTVSGTTSDGTEIDSSFVYPEKVRAYPQGGDVDGDGDDDLLLKVVDTAADSSLVLWSELDGDAFGPPQTFADLPGASVEQRVALGDFDGDQLLDAVVVDNNAGGAAKNSKRATAEVRSYFGTGSGVEPGPEGTVPANVSAKPMAADVDGDEMDELVLGQVRYDNAKVKVMEIGRDRIGRAQARGISRTGLTSSFKPSFGVSDVDGNGLDDIVLVAPSDTSGTAVVQVLTSDGTDLAASDWVRFDRDFATDKVDDFVDVLGEPPL